MKKFMLLSVMTLIFTFGCKKDEISNSTLQISFTSHPQGGTDISTLSANFSGKIIGNPKAIDATVEWWWDDGDHENAMIQKSEQVTFSSNNNTSKSTSYNVIGYVLLEYYWVKLTWTDDEGAHSVESGKAYCQEH